MSLLDGLLGALSGNKAETGVSGQLVDAVLGIIDHPGSGGLASLVQSFQDKGLGDVIGSWIGTGQNQPLSAEQVDSVLGSQQVARIAARLGLSPAETSRDVAQLLPQLIDRLTPDGKLPEGSLLAQGMSLLRRGLQGG